MRSYNELLSDRQQKILNHIVEAYVETAAPVGSRYLEKKYNLGISAATIRNVMNDLEELGYLSQPHISAGRAPTDKGYRFYVNNLKLVFKLKKKDRTRILESFSDYLSDVNGVLQAASKVLGQISSQLGVVLEPRFYQGVFQKMELVSISDNRIMAVISIESGLVKTIMMELESSVSSEQLLETSQIINERLAGLSLKELKETIDKRLADASISENKLIRYITESSDKLFNFDMLTGLHLGGTTNFISNPEFLYQSDVTKKIGLLESKESIFNKFEQGETEKLTISIGQENKEDMFRDCSVISTRYFLGNITGTLGVVGPTRMQYAKVISLVDFMGNALTEMFANKWS